MSAARSVAIAGERPEGSVPSDIDPISPEGLATIAAQAERTETIRPRVRWHGLDESPASPRFENAGKGAPKATAEMIAATPVGVRQQFQTL